MDLEKRLYEALKLHKTNSRAPRPDLFKEPSVGILRQTDHGPIWMVETSYDIGYLHGRVELSDSIEQSSLDIIDPICADERFDFQKIAVIDTETTGLAGGTGTYPFIIGIGFWLENKFIVRQYILRDFLEEPAQLDAFTADLASCSCILTYNGKSFDMPLLRTRYRINRIAIPFNDHIHLDLVHPCRRLYRRHYESFQLSLLEAMLIGFERTDDVPSHIIPRIYFDYLQNRDENLLLPILNHNRDDIVSLYLLAQETASRISLALATSSNDDLLLLSLGQILYKAKDYERSKLLIFNIKPQFAPKDVGDESLRLKAQIAKKMTDWAAAIDVWNQMIRIGRFGCLPHIELAKHYEHRMKDLRSALDLTEAAMRLLEFEREIRSSSSSTHLFNSLKRRHQRLMNKIDKF